MARSSHGVSRRPPRWPGRPPGRALAVALCLAGAGARAAPPPGEPGRDTVTLTFLGTTDLHGHVEAEPVTLQLDGGARVTVERGGLALLGGYLENARRAHPGRVVLLDSGDMLQGTLVSNLGEGQAMVRAMNALGYAAAAVGNHEFDFGPIGPRDLPRGGEDPRGALAARVAEARFPWLTANIVTAGPGGDAAGGPPPPAPGIRRFALLSVDGVRVGVIGGTSEDTPRTTRSQNLVGLRIDPLAPALTRAAAEARRAGATVVVAVVHEGGECARTDAPDDLSSCRGDSPIFQLARALPPGTVDALFAGHTHQGVAARVAGVPVLQAYSNAAAFSRLDLTVDRASGRVVPGGAAISPPTEVCAAVVEGSGSCDPRRARGRSLVTARYEGAPVVADAAVARAIAADLERAAALRARPVGVDLDGPLTRRHKEESALGDLAADALRAAARADVGLTNGGGLRADLPAGPLLYGALFQAFPFDNRLAVLRVPGAALRRLLEVNLGGDRGILSVSGLRVAGRCLGERLDLAITLEGGAPLDEARSYRVATSDFLAAGGDDFAALGGPPADPHGDGEAPAIRDLIADELRRRGPRLAGDGAVFDPARPRVSLPGIRPFRCGTPASRGGSPAAPAASK